MTPQGYLILHFLLFDLKLQEQRRMRLVDLLTILVQELKVCFTLYCPYYVKIARPKHKYTSYSLNNKA